jgi:hypothetical protein
MATFSTTVDADQGQVVSLGGPQGQSFELPLYGCNATTPDGKQANVLVVLSGVAVPADEALENPDPQEAEHHGTLTIETEYRSPSAGEQLCGSTSYVTLASINNDDEIDLIGIGFSSPAAIKTAQAQLVQDPGELPRIVLTLDPVALDGDTTINRMSYQLHLALYRPGAGVPPHWHHLTADERQAPALRTHP